MRAYPRNSPQAAGRLVALVLIADGHVCRSEFEVLERLGAAQALGLQDDELPRIVHSLCEDLLTGLCTTGALTAHLDEAALASLMAEVDDPRLQAEVLRLAQAAAAADGHGAEGETLILDAARRHWGVEQHGVVALAA
jgi:uncharacterized tellurite resistance protein B-like protein